MGAGWSHPRTLVNKQAAIPKTGSRSGDDEGPRRSAIQRRLGPTQPAVPVAKIEGVAYGLRRLAAGSNRAMHILVYQHDNGRTNMSVLPPEAGRIVAE
jgi:hypothetical protein